MFLGQDFQVVKVKWWKIKAANSKHFRKLLGSSTTTAESLDGGIMTMSSPCYHIQIPGSILLTKFSESFLTFILCELFSFRVLQVIVLFLTKNTHLYA